LIIKAENHGLFRGQIDFLLKKLDEDKLVNNLEESDLDVFDTRVDISYALWDADGSKEEYKEKSPIIRAILCLVDKITPIQIELQNSGDNWKALFRRNDIRVGLIKLFNELKLLDDKTIIKKLNDINEKVNEADWHYLLVKHESIIKIKPFIHSVTDTQVIMKTKKGVSADYNIAYISKKRDDFVFNLLRQDQDKNLSTDITIEGKQGYLTCKWINIYLEIDDNVRATITVWGEKNRAWIGLRKADYGEDEDYYSDICGSLKNTVINDSEYKFADSRNEHQGWWYFIREINFDNEKPADLIEELQAIYSKVKDALKDI
jgi:hypothetical protein